MNIPYNYSCAVAIKQITFIITDRNTMCRKKQKQQTSLKNVTLHYTCSNVWLIHTGVVRKTQQFKMAATMD